MYHMAAYPAYRHIELDKVGASKKRKNKKRESDSDDSEDDQDYVPSTKNEVVSEEDSDDSEEKQSHDEDGSPPSPLPMSLCLSKRRKTPRLHKKRTKINELKEDMELLHEQEAIMSKEQPTAATMTNIDDLWNEIKKECGGGGSGSNHSKPKPKSTETKTSTTIEEKNAGVEESRKIKVVTEVFEFAGEAIEVQKEVVVDAAEAAKVSRPTVRSGSATGGAGLASVLGQIGKKNKLSVLEKTKLDWDNFKKKEGIAEHLATHNKGKAGYLEKQDFLHRADVRQFEIEKAIRSNRRLK